MKIFTKYQTLRAIGALAAVLLVTNCGNVLSDGAPTDVPTAPTAAASTVISLYSDSYTDTGSNTNPGTGEVVTDETIAGNAVKRSTNYIPFQLSTEVDISTKATIHLDVWLPTKPSSGSGIVVKILDSPTEVQCTYPLASLTAGAWNSIDLALSSCTNATGSTWQTANQSAVDQVIIDLVDDATFYVDNVYFYGTGSGVPTGNCNNGCSWSQQAYLKAPNAGDNDLFGHFVALDGDTIVVGATNEDSDQTTITTTPGGTDASTTEQVGAAYVFVRSGTSWSHQAYLKAPNAEAGDLFGHSVSVSGDTIVVSALSEASNQTTIANSDSLPTAATDNDTVADSGAAYVFVRSGTTWSQQAYLKAPNAQGSDYFGYSVSVSGDTIVVGALREDSDQTTITTTPGGTDASTTANVGAAYVFVRSGTSWSYQAYLKAPNAENGDMFGQSVAVDGTTIVVSALKEASNQTTIANSDSLPTAATDNDTVANAGAAYVFVRSGTTWSQQAYLKAPNAGSGDFFGYSVSVSGDTIVLSALNEDSDQTSITNNITGSSSYGSDSGANNSGAAYVITRSGTTWSHQAYLKAPNAQGSDYFGFSVSISGDTIVVGAYYEDSDQTSITNGTTVGADPGLVDASESGAAYVFVRSSTTWSHQAYLKAPNAGKNDQFGYSVAVDGTTIVVGANYEDSNETEITNGLSASDDNSATNSGAAYVFVGTPN